MAFHDLLGILSVRVAVWVAIEIEAAFHRVCFIHKAILKEVLLPRREILVYLKIRKSQEGVRRAHFSPRFRILVSHVIVVKMEISRVYH